MNKTITKQELFTKLEKLPKSYLKEVLDFVDYLLVKKRSRKKVMVQEDLDPKKDPLLRFISSIEHGALTKDIDKELYGK